MNPKTTRPHEATREYQKRRTELQKRRREKEEKEGLSVVSFLASFSVTHVARPLSGERGHSDATPEASLVPNNPQLFFWHQIWLFFHASYQRSASFASPLVPHNIGDEKKRKASPGREKSTDTAHTAQPHASAFVVALFSHPCAVLRSIVGKKIDQAVDNRRWDEKENGKQDLLFLGKALRVERVVRSVLSK